MSATTKPVWAATDTSDATYLGPLEFRDVRGEWHNFEVLQASGRLVFGGACNVGFLESGYLPLEEGESTGAALSELLADLETFYNDGAQYVSRIVANARI